jgi:hypothetical protein
MLGCRSLFAILVTAIFVGELIDLPLEIPEALPQLGHQAHRHGPRAANNCFHFCLPAFVPLVYFNHIFHVLFPIFGVLGNPSLGA